MVLLEMEMLREIGRLNASPSEFLTILRRDFEVAVCRIPWHEVVEVSLSEYWTRDPFDRLIVANARVAGGKLATRDRRILENYAEAIW